ncbi:unnamed protein product [Closterium sp. NIES-54]
MDVGGVFSSDLLRDFFHGEGILQSFTLPASPQKNGIAERHIGLVMEVTRTSMINAAAPHFLWPLAVRYAAHQLNLWPCVSLPETSPTLRWTGKVGDASMFRPNANRRVAPTTSPDKLSALAIPCVFLGFPPDAPGGQFYHPTSHRVSSSHDVAFDKSVPFYCLFPYRSAPPPPRPLFLAPGPPPIDPLPPQGPAPSGVSHVDPLSGSVPVEVAGDSGAAQGSTSWGAEPVGANSEGARSGGVEPGGAEPGGAEPGGAEQRGADTVGVEPGGTESEGVESGAAEPRSTASAGGRAGASPQPSPWPEPLSLQQLREWFAQRTRLRSEAAGARDPAVGDTGVRGAGVTAGAGGTGGAAAAGPGGARTRGTRAAGTGGVGGAGAGEPTEPGAAGAGGTDAVDAGAGGAGVGGTSVGGAGAGGAGPIGAGAGGAGAGGAGGTGAGGTVRPQLYFVPLLQQVLGVTSSTSFTPALVCQPPDQLQPPLQPASPLPAPSPCSEKTGGLKERCELAYRPASLVRTGRRVPRPRPPLVFDTQAMAIRPSSILLRVPLPAPPESSLSAVPEPKCDGAHAANPDVSRVLATLVTDPSFESTTAFALVAELSESANPPSVGGECALGTHILEDRQEDFECLAAAVPHFASMLLAPIGDPDAPDIPTPRSYPEAITGPYSSQWQAAMDAQMASWKSTPPYIDAVPPSRANIVDGMWIFMVKRPPGSPPAFKARYIARGFRQRQGVDYFQTFFPTPKMTTLQVLLHIASQRDYELHSLDFSTAFLQGSLHEEIWLRHPPGFTGSFSAGTQSSLRRPVYSLRQAPREWHDTLRTTLAALGIAPSTTDLSLFLRTDTLLPPFYVLVTSGMRLVLGGRGPVVLTGHADASWVDDSATQRSSQGYTFSLGSGSVSWWSTRLSSVLSSSCEAEIYAGAIAAQELRWLTYLLTNLGEQPCSPPVLYVDNKAMIALGQEHRLEHRTKHIALRYFLARELQQGGQLRLAYVATRANTVDILTKALPPGDHQRFSTVIGLVPTLPHLLTA